MKTVVIVGAGFAGATVARRLADAGCQVRLLDRRPHIGGNAFDTRDAHGILIHPYGPHIFHTNSRRIIEFLSAFTSWRFYEHRVLAEVDGRLYPIPINATTLKALYGLDLDEAAAAAHFEAVRVPVANVASSEDVVLGSVGRDLCEKFFRNYTRKQWGLDLSELSAGVAARIPVRTNHDDRYFGDTYQFMPADGYTAMFRKMLDSPNIRVELGVDFFDLRHGLRFDHLVYTGPIDRYFDYEFGRLPYRSLRFEHEHFSDREHFQRTATVNFPNDHDYTRITEFKYLTGQTARGTSIVREYPCAEGEPFYPVPQKKNEALFERYRARASELPNVSFVGRLAQYRYYNMDQVVGAALAAADEIEKTLQP